MAASEETSYPGHYQKRPGPLGRQTLLRALAFQRCLREFREGGTRKVIWGSIKSEGIFHVESGSVGAPHGLVDVLFERLDASLQIRDVMAQFLVHRV